jgi:hypothetical protein
MAEMDHSELNRYSLDDIVIPATQLPATAASGGKPPSYRSILRSSFDRGKYELLATLSTKNLRRGSSDELCEISGWPRRPQQLKTFRNRVKHALLDVFMAGVALLWLVYGAYVYNLNGSPAHETEVQLVEAGRIVSLILIAECRFMTTQELSSSWLSIVEQNMTRSQTEAAIPSSADSLLSGHHNLSLRFCDISQQISFCCCALALGARCTVHDN